GTSAQAEPESQRQKACFWALASCLSAQQASDKGRNTRDHSPFTALLLRSLDQYRWKPMFTARQLSEKVRNDFESEGYGTQRPVFGLLGADDGDFTFYPDPTAGAGGQDPTLLARTLPGAQGGWWFDETPWLIPGLRADIANEVKDRSSA